MPNSEGTHPIGRDLIAGVVVFLVALPLCLGIALASGAPLQAGLISGIVGGLVVGFLSGSSVSVSGPAAGLAAIVLSQIESLGSFEAFLAAVMLSGVLQIGLGWIKAGGLANYFPNSVIKGLLAAIGVLLILKQVPHLLGDDRDPDGEMSFTQTDGDNTFTAIAAALERLLPGAVVVGILSLLLLIVWDRTRLKKSVVPSALVAVVLGTVVSELLAWYDLQRIGQEPYWTIAATHLVAVPVLGADGMGLGDVLAFPALGRLLDPQVLLAGVTLAIVASLETLLNLEATDKLDPLRRSSPPDRELVAQGVGNIVAGAIGGLPMTSVIVRSSVNVNAGGRTRVSAIFHGVLLMLAVGLFASVINRIPLAALAAVLVVTGFKLTHPKLWLKMWNEGWSQFVPFAVTVVAIVATDLLVGVVIGLSTGILFVLWRNLHGGFQVHREAHVGGVVHRIELANQASFIHRAHLAKVLEGFGRGGHVEIDARRTDYVDPDVLSLIREFVDEIAPARAIQVSTRGFRAEYELDDDILYADYSSREVQASLTPEAVLRILKDGNERFVAGTRLKRDLVRQVDATADGQHPMAVVLSCIDSRAPAEILFDLGIGDIFSVRVAGSVAKEKVLGSMEFACKVAGSKLILVLGHTRCGAVKASCDFVARGTDPAREGGLTNLHAITDTIGEAVRMETETKDDRTGANHAFVDRVTRLHVLNMMRWIRVHSPTIGDMLTMGQIGMVGGLYDVATGKVEFFDDAGNRVVVTQELQESAEQPGR